MNPIPENITLWVTKMEVIEQDFKKLSERVF